MNIETYARTQIRAKRAADIANAQANVTPRPTNRWLVLRIEPKARTLCNSFPLEFCVHDKFLWTACAACKRKGVWPPLPAGVVAP